MSDLILGKSGFLGRKVIYQDEKDIIFIVPIRSGYESKIITPNLYLNATNMVVFDFRGWYYNETVKKREKMGYTPIYINLNKDSKFELFLEIKNIDEVLEKLDNKFTLYINIAGTYEKVKYQEKTEEEKKEAISNLKELIEKVFTKIKENKINCISFINEIYTLFQWNIFFDKFKCKNNRMIFSINQENHIQSLNKEFGNSEFEIIDINNYSIFELVKDNVLVKKLNYKGKKVDFIRIKIKEEDLVLNYL